ncbi:hypothetical protein XaFJ1_GM000058 [Xanthomonas albilineans]|nr:hypothetical protein XaFJ1_GM000058 [Xanthomonas albilineans]
MVIAPLANRFRPGAVRLDRLPSSEHDASMLAPHPR